MGRTFRNHFGNLLQTILLEIVPINLTQTQLLHMAGMTLRKLFHATSEEDVPTRSYYAAEVAGQLEISLEHNGTPVVASCLVNFQDFELGGTGNKEMQQLVFAVLLEIVLVVYCERVKSVRLPRTVGVVWTQIGRISLLRWPIRANIL
jgi:hypothetical protein